MLTDSIRVGLTFDDVLLQPRHSFVLPHEVDLSTHLGPKIALNIPLISAAMDTVTEGSLAVAMGRLGGLGVLHKNTSIAQQVAWVRQVRDEGLTSAAAVGVGGDCLERTAALCEAGVEVLVVDTAHGHSQGVLDRAKALRDLHDGVLVLGNVATAAAVHAVADAGADVVKVGIGPGSICTTRIVAGVGVPQLTAIADCSVAAKERGLALIADGGIQSSGDIAKAIGAGADAVMLGSMFAGVDEAPGEIVEIDGVRRKRYRGMGSLGAMDAGSRDRYFQDGARKLVPEGVEATVVCKGALSDVVFQLVGGLRASMGYCGCPTLERMAAEAEFVRITSAGLRESHVHDVVMSESAPNYG